MQKRQVPLGHQICPAIQQACHGNTMGAGVTADLACREKWLAQAIFHGKPNLPSHRPLRFGGWTGPMFTIRRAQNEPSNPSIFGQMLSFEIFKQSESIGSTTYVVKFSYSNSF